MNWTLPLTRPGLGVQVRAGQRGPLIPATLSEVRHGGHLAPKADAFALGWISDQSLLVDSEYVTAEDQLWLPSRVVDSRGAITAPLAQPVRTRPILAARFAPTTDVQLTLHHHDLSLVLPTGVRCVLYANVLHQDGTSSTFTRSVLVDKVPPTGAVSAHLTPLGTFLAYHALSADAVRLTVTTTSGAYTVELPSGGGADVVLAADQHAEPLHVSATDQGGNESADLLLHVTRQYGVQEQTRLAAWPLTPDLDERQPVISALLAAFAAALDLHLDDLGTALDLRRSQEPHLSQIAQHFGVRRALTDTSGDVVRRSLAALTPQKSTLLGLEAMLRAHGLTGARVTDATQEAAFEPLYFDGTWTFDGAHAFDGGNASGLECPPGVVVAEFSTPPYFPLSEARTVVNRYAAAGVIGRARLHVQVRAAFPGTGLRARQTRRAAVAASTMTFTTNAVPLVFDGSWLLDGTQTFDGIKGELGTPTSASE